MVIFYLQPKFNFKFQVKRNRKASIFTGHSISHGDDQFIVLHEVLLGNVLILVLYGSKKTNRFEWLTAYFGFSQTVFSIKKDEK